MLLFAFVAQNFADQAVSTVAGGFEYVHKGYSVVETVEVFTLVKKVILAVATLKFLHGAFRKVLKAKTAGRKVRRARRRSSGEGRDAGRSGGNTGTSGNIPLLVGFTKFRDHFFPQKQEDRIHPCYCPSFVMA